MGSGILGTFSHVSQSVLSKRPLKRGFRNAPSLLGPEFGL
jgi:hypothetical protein